MSSSEYTPVDWPFAVALSSVVWQSWDLGHLLVVWCITGRWCRQQTNSTSGWSPPLALSNTFRVCEIFPVVCGAASFHGPKNSLQSVMNPTRAQLHWFKSSFLLNHVIATHTQTDSNKIATRNWWICELVWLGRQPKVDAWSFSFVYCGGPWPN